MIKLRRLSVLVAAILGLILLTAVSAWAGSRIVYVPSPNGTDDTANIQAALDTCVTYGKNCTVQLVAGTYLTRQLVAYNFRGTFKGLGADQTTIEALPNLVVNLPDPVVHGECLPNTTSCLWPSLIIFVDGDIHVSDLSIHITAPPGTATTGWTVFGLEISSLLDGLRFMGQHPTDVSIDRISIEGLPDNSPNSFGIVVGFGVGFNVVNEIIYTGELPRSATPFDYYFLTGSLTVRNSSFKMAIDGVSQDGFLRSGHITLGGSPSTGNIFENVFVGMDIEASESSVVKISHNESSGIANGMWVIPWQPVFVPSSPSLYLIHDNKFSTTGSFSTGILLFNGPTNPWIQGMIWNNSIELQQILSDGIDAVSTEGTAIWNNNITGTGFDAIGLFSGSTLSRVSGNNVSGFTPDPSDGLAQIFLDPSTTQDLVVCSSATDTVLNQGTNNLVIGCALSGNVPNSVSPATSKTWLRLPKWKLWLR